VIKLTEKAMRAIREFAAFEEEMGDSKWAMLLQSYDQLVEENATLRAREDDDGASN
jgi:hypothetical protein